MSVNFQLEWMKNDEYRSWLKLDPSYSNKAMYKLCMKTFASSTMGEPALKSHASSKNIKLLLGCFKTWISDYFKPKDSAAKEQKKTFRRGKSEWGNLTGFREPIKHNKICPKKGTKQSRNIVVLKSVMSHFSYSYSKDTADIFRALFPDNRIAHSISCGPSKHSYLICFGIAPFFKQ